MEKEKNLNGYTRIVVETDAENPVTVAEITADTVELADGYMVRFTPDYGVATSENNIMKMAEPLIDYLNEHCNPYTHIVISSDFVKIFNTQEVFPIT